MQFLSSFTDTFWRAWLYISSGKTLAIIFGIGFALLAITLFVLSRTRWGHSKALTKCVVLSVLAHVWLLMYALGTREVLPQGDPNGSRNASMAIHLEDAGASATGDQPLTDQMLKDLAVAEAADADGPEDALASADAHEEQPAPWEATTALSEMPLPDSLANPLPYTAELDDALGELLADHDPTPLPDLPPESALIELPEIEPPQSQIADIQQPAAQLASGLLAESDQASEQLPALDAMVATPDRQTSVQIPPAIQQVAQTQFQQAAQAQLPSSYQLRQASNRLQAAAAYGASADTEAAVTAGLTWLAQAQSSSGAWVARDFGAGTETKALGLDRYGTGSKADTGVSGLALLAFLSAGHTHLAGDFQPTVTSGLRYLLDAQMPSGDLSGRKQMGRDRGVLNARMYCHSIATLALAEAYAMTHDDVLKDSLLRAAQYSINAQDTGGGGWRYTPGEPGDLSQFGWQAMALKSIERSGIAIPSVVKTRMRKFLDACAAGSQGGLATYRPGEGFPSETMTAEALACRLLLGYRSTPQAEQQALDAIMNKLPGGDQDNVYYWYYATLALFQLQDRNWQVWNQALKARLLATQRTGYDPQPGSWDPDKLWGGYGGRVYSTAMSCLSLEVYYRFLPMYQPASMANRAQSPIYRR